MELSELLEHLDTPELGELYELVRDKPSTREKLAITKAFVNRVRRQYEKYIDIGVIRYWYNAKDDDLSRTNRPGGDAPTRVPRQARKDHK